MTLTFHYKVKKGHLKLNVIDKPLPIIVLNMNPLHHNMKGGHPDLRITRGGGGGGGRRVQYTVWGLILQERSPGFLALGAPLLSKVEQW